MKKRLSLGLTQHSGSRHVLSILASIGTVLAAVHCSSDPAETSSKPAGNSNSAETPPDSDDPEEVVGDAGTVVGSDGGTIDSGRDPNEVITVCGGVVGDPNAVPLVDWQIRTFPSKYAFVLGAESPTDEPISASSNGAIVTGTTEQDNGSSSVSISGGGPFGARTPLSRNAFAENLMPETDVALSLNKTLGWTDLSNAVYDLRTTLYDQTLKTMRVTGYAGYVTDHGWWLLDPVRGVFANDGDYYVQNIVPARGLGWFVTVLFDAECKGAEFDALVDSEPLAMFDPPAPHTRAEVSKFLVDNNARILLTVVTFGSENAAIKAALTGTQASAATLDAFESTMTALGAAMDSYWDYPGPPNYTALTAGTDPNWVIGSMRALPVPAQ